jgi:hypothetical protein
MVFMVLMWKVNAIRKGKKREETYPLMGRYPDRSSLGSWDHGSIYPIMGIWSVVPHAPGDPLPEGSP